MKKNKLTFLVAASFLALSTLIGCNNADEPSNVSSAPVTSTELPAGSDAGGNSDSDGGNQTGKTDWADSDKAKMRSTLHGVVLPFVEMDVNVSTNTDGDELYIRSTNNMAAGFLNSYAAKYNDDDSWEGGDISYQLNYSNGCAFAYQKAVTQNGNKYYVSVQFAGLAADGNGLDPNGIFFLTASDPYEYEYPASFIGQWLGQVYGTTIVPPAFQAEYYSLDEEGILYGYSETNIEASYKNALEATNNFTVDVNKDAEGNYVAHPKDGSYVLLFKYDGDSKFMILKVEENKGWNAALINRFYAKYNQTPLSFPALEIDGASYKFEESSTNEQAAASGNYGGVRATYTISKTGLTAAPLANYARDLREAGYAVNSLSPDNDQYILMKAIADGVLYSANVTYDATPLGGGKPQIVVEFYASGFAMNGLLANWPATQLAAFFGNEITDVLPAYTGIHCGFEFESNDNAAIITINLDSQASATIKADYTALLAEFTENGGKYISKNNQYYVRVGNPQGYGYYDIFQIRIDKIHAPVETQWPAESIANAITSKLQPLKTITDTIPTLDVTNASSCNVRTEYTSDYQFEIEINGLGSSAEAFKQVFKTNGWVENNFYPVDTTLYGGLVSPNRQLIVHFEVIGESLSLFVEEYFDQGYRIVGSMNNWNWNESRIFFDFADDPSYVSQIKAEFTVNAGDEFKATNGTEWFGFNALEANDKFVAGEGDEIDHNIKALEKGTVELFLKEYANGSHFIFIKFTADNSGEPPVASSWPVNAIEDILDAWNVTDDIPMLEDDSISAYELVPMGDSYKLTLVGGVDLFSDYVALLKADFTLNPVEGYYVSNSEKLFVGAIEQDDDLVIIFGLLEEQPSQEIVYKLVGSFGECDWKYEKGIELEEQDPESGYSAQYMAEFTVEAGDEFKVCDGTGDSGWFGGEILQANEWFEVLDGGNIKATIGGHGDLLFNILENGKKQIIISDFAPAFEQPNTWAEARYDALQACPEAYIPNLQIEGASGFVYDYMEQCIDINFPEGSDVDYQSTAIQYSLYMDYGFHPSVRFGAYVNVGADTWIDAVVDGNTIHLYFGIGGFADDDGGFGLILLGYDQDEDEYYLLPEVIGTVNSAVTDYPEYYVENVEFTAGMVFFIYDFGTETQFGASIDSASLNRAFDEYITYDENTGAYYVIKDFTGVIYIKLYSVDNNQIFIGFYTPAE